MIEYFISLIIGVIILIIGYYLSKIASEEVLFGKNYFEYANIILGSSIIYIISFLLGLNRIYSYIIAFLVGISLYLFREKQKLISSLIIYMFSLLFVAKYRIDFLIALIIIEGFTISAYAYPTIKKLVQKQ